jgi:hypothetical protein
MFFKSEICALLEVICNHFGMDYQDMLSEIISDFRSGHIRTTPVFKLIAESSGLKSLFPLVMTIGSL